MPPCMETVQNVRAAAPCVRALEMVNNNPKEAVALVYTTVQQDCIPDTISGAEPNGSV